MWLKLWTSPAGDSMNNRHTGIQEQFIVGNYTVQLLPLTLVTVLTLTTAKSISFNCCYKSRMQGNIDWHVNPIRSLKPRWTLKNHITELWSKAKGGVSVHNWKWMCRIQFETWRRSKFWSDCTITGAKPQRPSSRSRGHMKHFIDSTCSHSYACIQSDKHAHAVRLQSKLSNQQLLMRTY